MRIRQLLNAYSLRFITHLQVNIGVILNYIVLLSMLWPLQNTQTSFLLLYEHPYLCLPILLKVWDPIGPPDPQSTVYFELINSKATDDNINLPIFLLFFIKYTDGAAASSDTINYRNSFRPMIILNFYHFKTQSWKPRKGVYTNALWKTISSRWCYFRRARPIFVLLVVVVSDVNHTNNQTESVVTESFNLSDDYSQIK